MSPPDIKARAFFGLRTDIQSNAHYVTDTEVIYPAGGALILHEHAQKHQRFIHLIDIHKSIQSIAIAPNKKIVALSERADEQNRKPTLTIYDLETLKRKKVVSIPFEGTTCTEFVAVQFTCDSKYLVAITGEPDWMLYYYHWENGKIESQTKAQNSNGVGTVTQVNCNPSDAALIVITGPYTFRLMNVSETVWRQWGWAKADNLIITSCIWLTPDRVMFGTKVGTLMTVENGEIRHNCCYKALEVTTMNMKKIDEKAYAGETGAQGKSEQLQDLLTMKDSEKQEVRCLTVFNKGFAFACNSGVVHMFEKESPHNWSKRNIFKVMDNKFRTAYDKYIDLNIVQQIAVNPCQDTLLVTTLKSQLYMVKLFEKTMAQMAEIPFTVLGQMLHHSRINGLTMCSWKPIFMTSGQDDRSVRLWNYETEELELVKFYEEDINSISLHPSGLFALIGFSDKLRYMVVLIDDFHQMREFAIRNCKVCAFSNNGHLFAAVNGSIIQVFSSVSFDNVFNLKGHIGAVRAISWFANDDKLVSCGSDGAVYEWSTTSAKRVSEIILKNNDFTDCSARSDGKSSYVVGIDGEVKEVCNNAIIRNLKMIGCKLDNVVLARSDLMLFVTGGKGNVVSIQFPLLDKAVFAEFHMHNANVTGMALSYDDQTLITVAEDATMCIWKLINIEGKVIALDKDFTYSMEILINKDDLQEKINNIQVLTTRISEMETEHAYQMRQVKTSHAESLRDIHNGYSTAITELRSRNEETESKHSHEVNQINNEITKMKFDYERDLESARANFNEKLINEYNKYQALENQMAIMRENFEKELEQVAQNKRTALRELSNDYEAVLNEKKHIIEELEDKIGTESKEHEYIKALIEDDADRDIIEIKTAYETQLREEKENNVRLNGEGSVLRSKIGIVQKELEESKRQANQLAGEHTKFQSIIRSLEDDITDLKREISVRDGTIQEKEKRVYDLKMKNQELEKFKFSLNFKINELKNLIEPKEYEIEELQEHIKFMESEEAKSSVIKKELKFQVVILKEKLNSKESVLKKQLKDNAHTQNLLKRIKVDVFNLSKGILDYEKLKMSVIDIMQKNYMTDVDFEREKVAEEEVAEEFARQRHFLEMRITELTRKNKQLAASSQVNVSRLKKENNGFYKKINHIRSVMKNPSCQCVSIREFINGVQSAPSHQSNNK